MAWESKGNWRYEAYNRKREQHEYLQYHELGLAQEPTNEIDTTTIMLVSVYPVELVPIVHFHEVATQAAAQISSKS